MNSISTGKRKNIAKALSVIITMLFCVIAVNAFIAFDANAQTGGSGTQTGGTSAGGGIQTGETKTGMEKTVTFTLQNPLKVNSIGELVKNFVEIFSYIVILIAVVMLIYVGFQYIVASAKGDSGTIKELHSWLLWIVVGVAIVIGARVIVQVVINTISATGTVSPNVIQSANNALQK